MIIDFPLLLLGVLLLWFPRQWMRRGAAFLRRRRRSAESMRITDPWREREPGDPRVSALTEIKKFRNYLDLFRGAAGSLMLLGGMGIAPAIAAAADASRIVPHQVRAIWAFILLVGLLIQTLRYEKNRFTFYPPVFYLAGLSVGLCSLWGAVFAFVMVWSINPALPNARSLLSVYALLMVVFGYLFGVRSDFRFVYAGVLCFLPVLLSLLANRPLNIFTRKGTRSHGSP